MTQLRLIGTVILFVTFVGGAPAQVLCDPWGRSRSYPSCAAVEAGRGFGEALARLRDARDQQAQELSERIQRTRAQFLRIRADDPGRARAWTDFEKVLSEKDQWYLAKEEPALVQGAVDTILLGRTTVDVDGGISPFARGLFSEWENLLVVKTARQGRQVSLEQALKDSRPLYDRYRLARNWAELAGAGRNLTDNPRDYLVFLIAMIRPWADRLTPVESDLIDRSAAYYDTLNQAFGADTVLSATKRLMSAPRNKDAMLSPPLKLNGTEWNHPYLAFQALLGDSNPRGFLITLISTSGPRWNIPPAVESYRRWIAAYGEQAVFETADQVRRAPKTWDHSVLEITTPQALGVKLRPVGSSWSCNLYAVFQDILFHKSDARKKLCAILAFHDKLDAADLGAACERFISTHGGEPAIANAIARLDALQTTSYQLLSPEDRNLREALTETLNPGVYYDALTGILDGSRMLSGSSSPDVVDNPLYLAWSKFKPGTAVTYATRESVQERVPGGRKEDRGTLFSTLILKSADKASVVVERTEKRFNNERGPSAPIVHQDSYVARLHKSQIQDPDAEPNFVVEATGTETLALGGSSYRCKWRKLTKDNSDASFVKLDNLTIWTSDDTPGGLVRRLQEHREILRQNSRPVNCYTIETALQPTPTEDLSARTQIPPAVFGSNSNSAAQPEIRAAASSAPMQVEASGAPRMSTVPVVAAGVQIVVATSERIDAGNIQPNRLFRAQLAQDVQTGGHSIPRGTPVFLKVRNLGSGGPSNSLRLSISVDHVVINGENVEWTTTEVQKTLRTAGVPGPNQGRVSLGRFGSLTIPRHSSTGEGQDSEIAPNTRMSFTIAAR